MLSPIELCERGLVPDVLARAGMRRLIQQRLDSEEASNPEARSEAIRQLVTDWSQGAIAEDTDAANAQHYEVPAEFFYRSLGERLKYSCCYYPQGNETLEQAEDAMLALYAERAQLEDGMRVLDIGCGWGSLTLWMAEQYPNMEIVSVSNSHGQRQFIEHQAAERGFENIHVITCDINAFDPADHDEAAPFDRALSIEMFEHMRNYRELLRRISGWLKPEGLLFVHIFAHPHLAYPYEDRGDKDWMTRYFFTGGVMPSQHLLMHFQEHMQIADHWWVGGQHYERTSNQWLERMDAERDSILPLFERAYGSAREGRIWFQRWRMFYMAVAEFFGYREGREWGVGHYLFRPRAVSGQATGETHTDAQAA
ncbi:MAG: cyclopropane-fatty-acyl-phospholipid synthase family protein [Pseudomonadota bacterium]|nr:cyclopropane-fatty-acyl-phospholipid synthase family protein [Pseudomonadota bacterium]